MKYYIIAGEASGDLHGSNLIKCLKKEDNRSDFRVWGGDLMAAEGATLVKHYRDLAFMGFLEVVKNLRTILRNMDFCKKDILAFQPDVLILIDYPGFNLRIAKWTKQHNIRVFYYISPQIWAWHTSRVHQIKQNVARMYVILPFEKDFYKKYNYEVDFVGHPLLDAIKQYAPNPYFYQENDLYKDKKIIALLPGSRKQEIKKILPTMLDAASQFPDYQIIIAGAPSLQKDFYAPFLEGKNVEILFGKTYDILQQAHAALVTSGTATLETALFNVPQVVCYKGSAVSYQIAKRIIDIKYISLVNLIMDEKIVTELIQDDCSREKITAELDKILSGDTRQTMLDKYAALHQKLGNEGASEMTAKLMVERLKNLIHH
jgi:lipid-A-disaccharide synthase